MGNKRFLLSISILFALLFLSKSNASIRIPITIKNPTKADAVNYPVTVVIPLPRGKYHSLDHFQVVDSKDNPVPAQFEVLTRWWSDRDQSLRHVFVTFLGRVNSQSEAVYYFRDNGKGNNVKTPLKVENASSYITVTTGPIKFIVKKQGFNLFDGIWLDKNHDGQFTKDEQIVISDSHNGGVLTDRFGKKQYDSEAMDVKVSIEEQGPVRVVIKAEAPTHFIDGENAENSNVIHGYQVRIYAYAEQPFVKIEYSLRNTDKTVKYSFPMYMKDFSIRFKTSINKNNKGILRFAMEKGTNDYYQDFLGNGTKYIYQNLHNQYSIYDEKGNKIKDGNFSQGWADISNQNLGMTIAIRWFWQTWPKGFEVTPDGILYARLWPIWGRDWYWQKDEKLAKKPWDRFYKPAKLDLYWLDDMQQYTTEILYYFHEGNESITNIQKQITIFQKPLIGILSKNWYAKTKANFDLDGVFPEPIGQCRFKKFNLGLPNIKSIDSNIYNLGWVNFGGDISHRRGTECGGFPRSAASSITHKTLLYSLEALVKGELNVRPWWLPGYNFETDDSFLKLTHFSHMNWRYHPLGKPEFWKCAWSKYPYLPGSAPHGWSPLDTEHFWSSSFEEFYYLTGSKRIKDWYNFIGEHGHIYLLKKRCWRSEARAMAHILHSLVESYRVTGNREYLKIAKNFVLDFLKKVQNKQLGFFDKRAENPKDWTGEGVVRLGYLSRSLIYLYQVLPENDIDREEIVDMIQGILDWFLNYAHSYYHWHVGDPIKKEIFVSNKTSLDVYFADVLAWAYYHVNKENYSHYLEKARDCVFRWTRNVFTGDKWCGNYFGRMILWATQHPKNDIVPPAPITDLKAEPGNEPGSVKITWTAPGDDGNKGKATRYQIKYAHLPIVEDVTKWYPDMEEIKKRIPFWAATNVQGEPEPAPAGTRQSFIIKNLSPGTYYFAIKSYDDENNLSELSNLVSIIVYNINNR